MIRHSVDFPSKENPYELGVTYLHTYNYNEM